MARNVITYGDAYIGGSLQADEGFVGNVLGNVAGHFDGTVTGSVTGNVAGDVTGNVTGHLCDPANVTPVNAVAATAVITYQNAVDVTAGKKVTIGSNVYTFRVAVAVDGDVKIGPNADGTFLSLARAINKSGGTEGVGQDYLVTAAHPDVAASQTAASDIVTVAAKVKGTAANAVTITTDEATITLSGATLGAGAGVDGVDGTVGAKGDIRWDESYIYVCTAANLISGSNWKRLGNTLAGF